MSQRYIGGLIYNPPGGFSGQFGAASNTYLTTASDAAFAFGTGDFTMEAFVFATASQTDNWIIGLANNCWLRIGSGGALEFYNNIASSSIIAGSAMPTNQWVHVAAVRSGTTLTLYQNGVSVASGTVSTNFSTSVACVIGNQVGFDRRWNGFISNVRVVKGTAVYTSAFTPPNGRLQAISGTSLLTCAYSTFVDGSTNNFTLTNTGGVVLSTQNPFPLTTLPNPALGNAGNGVYSMSQYQALKQQNLWPALDQRFNYVTMLLHGDGTNGAQNNTFLDGSTNNFTITRNGNTTQGTFSPYGSNWSNYFDGTGDYLASASIGAISGDFTIECWAFISGSGDQALFGMGTAAASGGFFVRYEGNTVPQNLNFYTTTDNLFNVSLTRNFWYHIAFTRQSNSVKCWVNGTQVGSAITISDSFTSAAFYAGAGKVGATVPYNPMTGYISNLRVVAGTALYTSAFTPSTTPLTAVSGTSLLTCQSNRFIDNSSNNFTITRNGDVSVQRFSPFSPTAAYSAATVGGSGYFDGSGDYLLAPASSNLEFGSGDFTIEFWWYTTVSTRQALYHGSFGTDWSIGIDCSSQKMGIWASSTGTSWNLINADPGGNGVGTITVPVNQWNHIAYVRSGTTWMLYVNGVRDLNLTGISGSIVNRSSDQKAIGAWWSAGISPGPTTGYIQDFRILKGTALYTGATYTVPTAPLTAITNTQLLLNFTNAGIIDNAMMNDLETVGNAQISTSVKKYGTGSLAFDGTGDWLVGPNTPNTNIDSGDFTFEAWVYLTDATSVSPIVAKGFGSAGGYMMWVQSTLRVRVYDSGGTAYTATSSASVSSNTWTHVAGVRSGNTITVYINGTASGTVSYSGTSTNSAAIEVGGYNSGTVSLNGYIDDLRITKGYARYTANFTPPTSQLQDQ